MKHLQYYFYIVISTFTLFGCTTMNDKFSLSAQGTNGEERSTIMTASGPEGLRSIIDLIATYNPTKQLGLIANYDYAMQTNAALPNGTLGKAVWQGIAGYVNYKFTDKWHSSVRGEIFSDRNGFRTGIAQCWEELTLTIGYIPIEHLEFRAETRHDFLSKRSIVNKDGVGTSNNQQSFALQAIYSFP